MIYINGSIRNAHVIIKYGRKKWNNLNATYQHFLNCRNHVLIYIIDRLPHESKEDKHKEGEIRRAKSKQYGNGVNKNKIIL